MIILWFLFLVFVAKKAEECVRMTSRGLGSSMQCFAFRALHILQFGILSLWATRFTLMTEEIICGSSAFMVVKREIWELIKCF